MRRMPRIVAGATTLLALFGWLSASAAAPGADSTPPVDAPDSPALERLEVYPPEFKLQTPRRQLCLVVLGHYSDGTVRDLTGEAEFLPDHADLVSIEGHTIRPAADGSVLLSVAYGGLSQSVPIEISGQQTPEPVSFKYGTLVALSKRGCNSGACHGSPSGKSGFRLSLRAYDPAVDRETLVREVFNRRTNVNDPEASLLLRKPLMEIPHGGGRRLEKGDVCYELLRDWIAEGLDTSLPEVVCTRVEVWPQKSIRKNEAKSQQLVVLAHFSDGSIRDITDMAAYSSSDEAIATVDDRGHVTADQSGEAAILVRYLEHIETAQVTFLEDVAGFQWPEAPQVNYIDRLVHEKLNQMQIAPSLPCDDEEFIRRVYLDTVGRLPAIDETLAFLEDESDDRRSGLIDRLLEDPGYASFWGQRWGDLLRVNNKKMTPAGVHKYNRWIVAAWRDNMPYDQFVRHLLTSVGSTFDNPPANYYRAATDTNDCTETTAQLFLGIRIQCAKCHNHPFERWTQDNYYGIGAFFHRVQRKASNVGSEQVIWVARGGEVTQPRTGQQMDPWLPLKGDTQIPAQDDRRTHFVDWLVEPDNPFFAHAEINRLWSHLMGRGIVEPVDDFRASNPPSNAPLLEALAQDFVEQKYDRKHLIRTILSSQTYQASSRTNEFNKDDEKYFSHARTRLLSAEQLLDAICQMTEVSEKYAGLPSGVRATELPSPDVDNDFLKVFGQPAREMACQCERSTESNLSQALQMINGPLVHGKLTAKENRFRKLIAAGADDNEVVRQLYLAALCRTPAESEISAALAHIGAQENREQGLEDVCWALLNAKEFLFQH